MIQNDIMQKWKLAVNAYNGDGGFSDGTYLSKFGRESDDKYKNRKETSVYYNMFSQKVERYIGYLFSQKPTRNTRNKLIKEILADTDKQGNSIDSFMSDFSAQAKVRGSMLLLVDMPKELSSNLKDQIDNRELPYFVPIEPERLTKYELDNFGNFLNVRYTDTIRENGEDVKIERYYDLTKWVVYEGDEIKEQGEHNLGVCPVLAFSEKGSFPSAGEFTQIGDLAKDHFNKKSELDEILRAQTFSILTIQARDPKDVVLDLGTDNAISYAPDMAKPDFIAPPEAPASTYQKEKNTIEQNINDVAYDIDTNKGVESGISLTIKFQGLNSSLSKFATKLNNLEYKMFDIAFRYIKSTNDISIQYPTDFNIIDIKNEISILEDIKNLGYKIPTYEKLKLTNIIQSDLGHLNEEDKAQILSEIEDSVKEPQQPA